MDYPFVDQLEVRMVEKRSKDILAIHRTPLQYSWRAPGPSADASADMLMLDGSVARPGVLKVGEPLEIKLKYQRKTAAALVWINTQVIGNEPGVPRNFVNPSAAKRQRNGTMNAWVGLDEPGTIKAIRIQMTFGQTVLSELEVPIMTRWER